MVNMAPNSINAQATRESSRRSWSAVRGSLRLVLGLVLVLPAPLQLGIAFYDRALHGVGDGLDWPHWSGWVMALCGIGVLSRGVGLRRSGRQKMTMIAEKWAALESERAEVERVFSTLVGAGHYEIGLSARHECARAERVRVGAWIAEHRPPGFFASLSEASAGAGDEILARMERLADADAAIMAARGFFALSPGWRDVWKTEVGPIIEDLDILDDVADTLESVNTDPRILMDIEAFRERVGDDKDMVNDLGTRLEGGQIAPLRPLKNSTGSPTRRESAPPSSSRKLLQPMPRRRDGNATRDGRVQASGSPRLTRNTTQPIGARTRTLTSSTTRRPRFD